MFLEKGTNGFKWLWIKKGEKRKTIYIMMGLQGSGKTTFCQQYLSDVRYVNLDTLNTRNKEALVIQDCLNNSDNYVVDNTNPTRQDRLRYIPNAKEHGYHIVGYYMQSHLQECIKRNNERTGKKRIPSKAIAMTSNKLELPSYDEGFDELYYVKNDGKKMVVEDWREEHEV